MTAASASAVASITSNEAYTKPGLENCTLRRSNKDGVNGAGLGGGVVATGAKAFTLAHIVAASSEWGFSSSVASELQNFVSSSACARQSVHATRWSWMASLSFEVSRWEK